MDTFLFNPFGRHGGDLMTRVLRFVTSNCHKVEEAQRIAEELGRSIEISQLQEVEKVEIQAESLTDVVEYAARKITEQGYDDFFLEDAGLFINRLNGFPGVFSHFVFKKLGNSGILTLMEDISDKRVTFKSVVALRTQGTLSIYQGMTKGRIAESERGERGFGFDPIFIPARKSRTFAEMNATLKNRYSHRGKSVRKMLESVRHE